MLIEEGRRRRSLPEPAERRRIRERATVTQAGLAQVLGVHQSTVNKWEAGTRSPQGDLLARYLEALARLAGAIAP